jgi:FKBP-type peptidyl-prolyl cis-trans isomerase
LIVFIVTITTMQDIGQGDMVGVKYTGWLEANSTIGTQFDSNAGTDKVFKMTIGSGKTIKGWEDGVTGILLNLFF